MKKKKCLSLTDNNNYSRFFFSVRNFVTLILKDACSLFLIYSINYTQYFVQYYLLRVVSVYPHL